MKRKLRQRVMAIFSAVLMVIGTFPAAPLSVVNAETADESSKAADRKAYVFDASDYSPAFNEQGKAAVTEDTKVGTDDFFTVSATGSKNLWVALSDSALSCEMGEYTQALQLGGGLNSSTGQAGISFEISSPVKVIVYDAVKAVNEQKHSFQYAKEGSDKKSIVMENDKSVVNRIEFTLEEAGKYWIGGDNGGNILYIEVQTLLSEYSVEGETVDASLFTVEDKPTLIADTTLDGFFKVTATGNKVKLISGQSVAYGNKKLTTSLRLDGSPNFSTGQATVEFTADEAFRLTLVAAQKGSSVPVLKYSKDGGAAVELSDAKFEVGTAAEYVIELPAGTYRFGAQNGLDIFEMSVKYIEKYTMNANDLDTAGLTETAENKYNYTADTAVGTENFYTISGTQSKNFLVKLSSEIKYNGNSYSQKVQLNSAFDGSTGKAAIKINVEKTAKVTIIAAAKGASAEGKALVYSAVGDSQKTAIGTLGVTDAVDKYTIKNLKPGEYYIGGESGADIYEIIVEYDPVADKASVDWETVETPVINSVTVNADGNFVVDFDAVIDAVNGAEVVRVTMLESGYEVSTQTFKAQNDTAEFTPLWSGNYTFVATAQRTGNPDKASEAYAYDNYTLAVKKPVITWAQNKGNGSVYLDWVNLEDADTYAVSYREEGSGAEFTYAADNLSGEQADYTVTGLTAGKNYEFKIEATRNSDNFVANATAVVEVTAEADQNWYVATVGSAQATDAVITTAEGTASEYHLSSADSTANKTNNVEATDISNTNGTIDIAAQSSGKISDDEDGYSIYYTKIDPDTENFKLSAKFTVTDNSLTPDNQTGFGIIAADTLGINNWGNPDYVHKYFNYTSSMLFSHKSSAPVMRTVTGYTSADTSNNDGAERTITNSNFSGQKASFEVGTEYEFSLEKTDEGYKAVCNGVEQSLSDNSFTSVQEDGTIVVGVMASRKVGVKVSNITFEKSASSGITSSDTGDDKIAPSGRVYSSGTVGASEYEFIYVPNCSGKLTVTGPEGTAAENLQLAAGEAARVKVAVNLGSNEINYTFVPDAADNITSAEPLSGKTTVKRNVLGEENGTLVVSPDGTADGDGTEEKPLNISTAVQYAQPGQTILLKNGTYTEGATIQRSVSGTSDKMITMVAETTGEVVFSGAGINLIGDYWHIYGVYVKDASGVGIQISGNNNIVEMCTVEHSANSGVQISRSGSADNITGIQYKLWPTDNLVKNCESFDNCDAGRNDADGFAAKLTCGNGNKFYGCISHNNIDDGWDLYAKSVSGEIGAVVVENCVAYNNGWLTTDDTTDPNYVYGEGNGFKLGGGYLKGGHILKNSITFNNHGKGITSNSCPDIQIINCTSFNNSIENDAYNIGLNTKESNRKEWVVTGLISLNNSDNTILEDLIPFALHSADNYIYDGSAAYNNQGVQATEDWFVSVDTSVVPERNEDGTINMHGLLELNADAPSDTGARLDVTSDEAKSERPSTEVKPPVTEPGDIVVEVVPQPGAPETSADIPDGSIELTDEEKTAVENGDNLTVTLKIENADNAVSEEDKAVIDSKIKEAVENGVVGQYLDISLLKKIGDAQAENITNTKAPVKISITIPESLKNTDTSKTRVYQIIRVHEGVAEVLESSVNEETGVITFSTDRFSTYAIVYADTEITSENPDDTKPENPDDVTPENPDDTKPVTPETPDDTTQDTPQSPDDVKPDTQEPGNDNNTGLSTPDTGDTAMRVIIPLIVVMAVAAVGAAAVLISRNISVKKQKSEK